MAGRFSLAGLFITSLRDVGAAGLYVEGRGVTSSIPITTTITQPSLKTCPEWWMIKTRVKSPALQHRLMIILPAIAHGRSDGFIATAAAAESRQEESNSGGFKILVWHTKKEEKE